MKRYKCDVCGYIYDPAKGDPDHGVQAETAFEQVPADWDCPECGASKDEFGCSVTGGVIDYPRRCELCMAANREEGL